MAKIRKRKRKTNKLEKFAVWFFTIAIIAATATSLFVGTYNTNLTMEIQNMNNQISSLKSDNEKITIEISSLENKERVYTVASDAGLDQNQENIISIKGAN